MPTELPSPDKESIVQMPNKFANWDKYPASFSSQRKDVLRALPDSAPLVAGGAELDRGFDEWSGGKRRKHQAKRRELYRLSQSRGRPELRR